LINCITTSLGGHQHWPTVRDVYILYVGLWNWLLRISRHGNTSFQKMRMVKFTNPIIKRMDCLRPETYSYCGLLY
jgi:hypothetical protein